MATTALAPVQPLTDFRGELGSALNNQVTTGSADRLPTVSECAVHLELLHAIVRVEGEVAAWGKQMDLPDGTAWNIYCSAAAKRFLQWTRLAEGQRGNTPPLDVLIVWHAYMLNTAAYKRYETTVLKGRMCLKGIDWAAVHRRIDDDNGFDISAEDTTTENKLPFPMDLLAALKSGEVQIDSINPLPSTKFDMVAAVQRQLKFAHKMHDAKWLQSPFAARILETAVRRYEMFFTLIAENPDSSLSPTLDIDLVWHTHQLLPARYGLYSTMKANGRFVNHNDNAGKPALEGSFTSAKTLFRARFGSEYQLCFCESCIMSRGAGVHPQDVGSADCSGESCIPSTCNDSCGAECSGDSCQAENL